MQLMPELEEATYRIRPLDASTWDAFAELVERNNGIYGGCWCIAFHTAYERGVDDPRALKEQLVRDGEAHAALVFEGDQVQGWAQYGDVEELGLRHLREYAKDPPPPAERSEEHTSELQSLMRISYAVFCLKKKTTHNSLSMNMCKHTHEN